MEKNHDTGSKARRYTNMRELDTEQFYDRCR